MSHSVRVRIFLGMSAVVLAAGCGGGGGSSGPAAPVIAGSPPAGATEMHPSIGFSGIVRCGSPGVAGSVAVPFATS